MATRKPPRKAEAPEHTVFRMREDGKDRIEVHVAGVCMRIVNGEWKILAAQRTAQRSLFPGKWECGGGMVRRGESFESALKRQMFEEFGLDVQPYLLLQAYEIHVPGQRIIPGVRFVCLAHEGSVHLNTREFSRYRWLSVPVPKSLDWIGGIKEVLDTFNWSSFQPIAWMSHASHPGSTKSGFSRDQVKSRVVDSIQSIPLALESYLRLSTEILEGHPGLGFIAKARRMTVCGRHAWAVSHSRESCR